MVEADYIQSRGYSKLLKSYEDLMTYYGWKFKNNYPSIDSANKHKMCFLGDGLDVFIGPFTFDSDGNLSKRAVPLFTREKRY